MMKTLIAALMMAGTVGIGSALGLGLAPAAHAETGTKPHLDILCMHPAFAASAPTSSVNGKVVGGQAVGLRAQNAYCSGPDLILPPDYGSGAEVPVLPPVLP